MRCFPHLRCDPILLAVGLLGLCLHTTHAEDSAPSSHFVFDDRFAGDIVVNEVRVPTAGETTYTYYETLGWRGRGGGYAGIQAHPKSHLFIFSIWDHKEHTAPIKAIYRGPGTETVGFGGEGTGLKSWNFELGWKTDVWYTLVARAWSVGEKTRFGFWSRDNSTAKWTHVVTMEVAAKNAFFEGGTDAFLEDWSNTGAERREVHYRGGWKRQLDGEWTPFRKGRYSVNFWDLDPGKRSYSYRTNWNGGVGNDQSGEYFFMIAGGDQTKPTATNPSVHQISRAALKPRFEAPAIRNVVAEKTSGNEVTLRWDIDSTATPQFSYVAQLVGEHGQSTAQIGPHHRETKVVLKTKISADARIRLSAVDIFGTTSKPVEVRVD